MNSTFKIDYNSQSGKPVIKIIFQELPVAEGVATNPGFAHHEDDDVRDKMIREFLKSPLMAEPYELYQKGCSFPIKDGKRLVTIEPVQEENLFYMMRHVLLNRFVPYDDLVKYNHKEFPVLTGNPETQKATSFFIWKKINDFFDDIDKTEYASWEERYPNHLQF